MWEGAMGSLTSTAGLVRAALSPRATQSLAEVACEPFLGGQAHDDRLGRARIVLGVPLAELRPQIPRSHCVVVALLGRDDDRALDHHVLVWWRLGLNGHGRAARPTKQLRLLRVAT